MTPDLNTKKAEELAKVLQLCEFISGHECWQRGIGFDPRMCSHCQEALEYSQPLRKTLLSLQAHCEALSAAASEVHHEATGNYGLDTTRLNVLRLALDDYRRDFPSK